MLHPLTCIRDARVATEQSMSLGEFQLKNCKQRKLEAFHLQLQFPVRVTCAALCCPVLTVDFALFLPRRLFAFYFPSVLFWVLLGYLGAGADGTIPLRQAPSRM